MKKIKQTMKRVFEKPSAFLIVAIIVILGLVAVVFPIITSLGALSGMVNQETCEHENRNNVLAKYTQDSHTYDVVCKDCGEVLKSDQNGAHIWSSQGVCMFCKYTCKHILSNSYTELHALEHRVDFWCNLCAMEFSEVELHTYVNGTCNLCGASGEEIVLPPDYFD